jgi:hypothetical protein
VEIRRRIETYQLGIEGLEYLLKAAAFTVCCKLQNSLVVIIHKEK